MSSHVQWMGVGLMVLGLVGVVAGALAGVSQYAGMMALALGAMLWGLGEGDLP